MHHTTIDNPRVFYISTGEACELLNCDRNELRTFMIKKQLEWDNVAGKVKLYRASVEAFAAKQEKKETVGA